VSHDSVWVAEEDRPFALRLARYCARNPVALERLRYDAASAQVTYRSDKAEGPTAGDETVDALEFLARLVTHIPDPTSSQRLHPAEFSRPWPPFGAHLQYSSIRRTRRSGER